jgi:hypothetical protein
MVHWEELAGMFAPVRLTFSHSPVVETGDT